MVKRMFHISNLLLATLAVYGSVTIFYEVLENGLRPFEPVSIAGKPIGVAKELKIGTLSTNYDVIIERNLFNTAKAAADKLPEPDVDLSTIKPTDLKLKLWGTVATEDRKAGLARAVIEERKSKEQYLYRVGDVIEHAKISEILRNSVVLDVNGRKEKLTVEEKIPGRAISIASDMSSPVSPASEDTAKVLETGQKISLQRSQVDNALKDVDKLISEVKIRPYYQEGQTAGFVVANIAQESVVREMGLKSGDIVIRINGGEIKTPEDAMAFYESLQAGDTLSIDLMRRGRQQTIEYTVEDEMLSGE